MNFIPRFFDDPRVTTYGRAGPKWTMTSNKLHTRSILGIATVLLAVAGFTAASPAHALPQNSATRTYYNNAAHSHIVGHQDILYCGGGHGEVEGTKTVYYTTKYLPCP